MRIVGGELRGGKLLTFRGEGIRPTADKVRESIFNIIRPHVPKAEVLDLFAGTGALGIEALSRGAAHAVFVDRSSDAVSLVGRNIKKFSLEGRSKIVKRDITKNLNPIRAADRRFGLVFMDPPYNKGFVDRALSILHDSGLLDDDALVVIEHSPSETVDAANHFEVTDTRRYGKTLVSFATHVV